MANLEVPAGFKVLNAEPLDGWSGPYSGATESVAKAVAVAAIPLGVRYATMEVTLIIAGTAKKYWFSPGITDSDLKEVASEAYLASQVAIATQKAQDAINAAASISGTTQTANQAIGLAALGFLGSGTSAPAKPTLSVDNAPLFAYSTNSNIQYKNLTIVNCFYPDQLWNSHKDVYIDNNSLDKGRFYIDPTSPGTKTIPLKSNTYDPISPTFNSLVANLSTFVEPVRLMGLTDSKHTNEYFDAYGSERGYWNSISKAIFNIHRYKIDKGSTNAIPTPLMIGNNVVKSRTFTWGGQNTPYKGTAAQTVTYKGGVAGQNGWTGASYLRHALNLCATTSTPVNTLPYVAPDISYYLLGLTASKGAWTGSADQRAAIRVTVQGKNACDKNATLYNWMKVRKGWPGANDTYTGTTTQNNNMDAYHELILTLDNSVLHVSGQSPEGVVCNPFFSVTQARTTDSTHAMSPSTYLSRYRTRDINGNLLPLNQCGSKITDPNSMDVCEANYIACSFGQNDGLFHGATATEVVLDMRQIAEIFVVEWAAVNVKVGLFISPRPGGYFPEFYPGGRTEDRNDPTSFMAQIDNALIQNLGITSTVTKTANRIHYVPVFLTSCPRSGEFDQPAETAGKPILYEDRTKSHPHEGIESQASDGDTLSSWIIYASQN